MTKVSFNSEPNPKEKAYASIDIGSNSMLLLIATLSQGQLVTQHESIADLKTAEDLSEYGDDLDSGMNSQDASLKNASELNRVFGNTPEDLKTYGQ